MNLYELLGVSMDASPEEIRTAYFDAAKRYHPDLNKSHTARDKFEEIKKAFETLGDLDRRADYDQSLIEPPKGLLVNLERLTSSPVLRRADEQQLLYLMLRIRSQITLNESMLPTSHVCFVVDKSTSMQGERIEALKTQLLSVLGSMRQSDHVSIVVFSDRAELLLSPTAIRDMIQIEAKIHQIKTGGATEIFQGLQLGMDVLEKHLLSDVNLIVLITDGQTYGDEDKCLELARVAAAKGVVIHAIGLGDDWNDLFLDQLVSASGGTTNYLATPERIRTVLKTAIGSSGLVVANNLVLNLNFGRDVSCRSIYRIEPDLFELPISQTIRLGNLFYQKMMSVMIELTIENTKSSTRDQHLVLSGALGYQRALGTKNNERIPVIFRLPLVDEIPRIEPSPVIVQAVSRMSLFKMQHRARVEVAEGQMVDAARHLHQLATHLLERGERDLARMVLLEAEQIQRTRQYSASGEKNIKYGTRGLLKLPPARGRSEDDSVS